MGYTGTLKLLKNKKNFAYVRPRTSTQAQTILSHFKNAEILSLMFIVKEKEAISPAIFFVDNKCR